MKLTKRSDTAVEKNNSFGLSRRNFIRNSSLTTASSVAAFSLFAPVMMKKASAEIKDPIKSAKMKRTICTHCSVGCGVYAKVQDGVWTDQEPAFDHPFNSGGHCAKGAALREHGHGARRLKYPMKLVDGNWHKVSWEQAIDEISEQVLTIREQSGPDAVYFLGSAKHNNEQAYLFRKMASFWGTNNVDHQARICHSTTVAGVANTWGYGAMTNSFNDMHNCKSIFFIGSNPAEAHPVAMQHILIAKEKNDCKIVVADPRRTKTAAKAEHYVYLRPGTDVALVWGLLWHIFENKWEDKEFIHQRVFGMDEIRAEVSKWHPEEVERVSGSKPEDVFKAAKIIASNKPGCIVWCMGGTQHTTGNNNTRAYCILELALGNIGKSGGGANIFRGHDNVQGATDLGVLANTLPGYYGLSEGAWKHWSKVWNIEYEWIKARFDPNSYNGTKPMNTEGIPVSRWIDGVLENKANIAQKSNLRAMFYWGHAVNSQTRGTQMRNAMSKLDLMVIVDPFPTVAAVMNQRKNGVYLLPATTQFETYGSVTASNRSLQWRDKIIEPLFDSKPDHTIMYLFAKKFGYADKLFQGIQIINDEPVIEDITREFNRGMWTIGYTGQSPERIKEHQQNWHTFNKTTLEAQGGPVNGQTYGLPWPCWGTPEMMHPGTHILYDTSKEVARGGGNFRARFGVEFEGQNLLAVDSYSKGCELENGYPEFTDKMLKQLGWWNDLTETEKLAAEGKNWKTDLSGGIQRVAIKHGCIPYGNAKARTIVWTFPDKIPLHREPLYTPRRDLLIDYPTWNDKANIFRLPTLYKSIQDIDSVANYPIILTSGRIVEYEGGGEETRSNPWLAELQQEMFIEINIEDANNLGIIDGKYVWVEGAEKGRVKVKAMITARVRQGLAFMPFHFGGVFEGESLLAKYPKGSNPYVIGEACNTATTYGYDPVTVMQETKVTLCKISPV